MKRLGSWLRFASVTLVLACTAFALNFRDRVERLPDHRPLSQFPLNLGEWHGTEMAISSEDRAILGPGQFLVRDYRSMGKSPSNLFLAFYPSQRSGDTIHSPQNCLPGSGWTPLKSGRISIKRPDGKWIEVNRYIVGKGLDRMLVLYWYQAHGRVTPGEYSAKLFLVLDAIKMNRTDGALVRIIQSFANPSKEAEADQQAIDFANQIFPILDSYIPI